MGLDTKTYWLTDRQSQCEFHFNFDLECSSLESWVLQVSLRGGDDPVQSRKELAGRFELESAKEGPERKELKNLNC
jgi:hypothetical protein